MTSNKFKMMLQAIVITSVGTLSPFALASASDSAVNLIDVQKQSSTAPVETAQFGALVGNWKIDDFFLDKKGQWQSAGGANWHFYWILGGTAIQDDWISPAPDKPAPKAGRQYGTNIRIYNPKLKRWEMAWASNNGAKVDTFVAVAKGKDLVMSGIFNGKASRITFYDISHKNFSWKLEQKNDVSSEFKEIYRIRGERIEDKAK